MRIVHALVVGWALVLLAVVPAAAEPADSPVATVDRLHETLVGVMKDAETLGYAGRAERLAPAVARAYDMAFMARKSVGRHWKELTPEEREHFVERFGDLTVATYAGRFTGWSGEEFHTEGSEPGVHDTVLVKTVLVRPDDEDVHLDYRLHRDEKGAWRIIDVYMNGTISELAMRRSEYSALLRREGYASLMAALDKKIAEFRES